MAHALRRPYRARSAAPMSAGRVARRRPAGAMGSGLFALARLVRLATMIAVALIVAAIVLRLVGANPANVVVRDIHDAGRWLVSPFANVFTAHSAKESMVLNWGLAGLVYLLVGTALARLLARRAV